jgi:uncharacterized repeat protein (TIGR03943 family)
MFKFISKYFSFQSPFFNGLFYNLFTLLFSLGVLLFSVGNKLGFYVHIRYHIAITIVAVILFILTLYKLCFDLLYLIKKKDKILFVASPAPSLGKMQESFSFEKSVKQFSQQSKKEKWGLSSLSKFFNPSFNLSFIGTIFINSVIILVLVVGFILPSKPLSSSLIPNRRQKLKALDSQLNIQLQSGKASNNKDLVIDTFDLRDWSGILAQENGFERYKDQSISVTGFVSDKVENNQENNKSVEFTLNRFSISCCAVDASIYQLPVLYKKDQQKEQQSQIELKENIWLKVNGKIRKFNNKLGIEVINMEVINTPVNPYIY